MRPLVYGVSALGGVTALLVVVTALTAGADPATATPSDTAPAGQAADAAQLLREIEVTEDLSITSCMGEAGFEFYSVPLSATPDEAMAVIDAQNAYVDGLSATEQARFERTFGDDEVRGCLAQAQEMVSHHLPAGIEELAMTVQLDPESGTGAISGAAATDTHASSYESDAALARQALAAIAADDSRLQGD